MSNLLVITDVARLRKIFGRLTDDKNIRLRIVNNLEKGGEEIAIEKPDVVFVQTHLSGLSADILLMHLKKQLGRKRSRFVLLAAPGQTSESTLKQYQGWLDTSVEESKLIYELHSLLAALLERPKKKAAEFSPEPALSKAHSAQSVTSEESAALLPPPVATEPDISQLPAVDLQLPAPTSTPEPSLEEQGITYAPRQRLKIYSEFTTSFDDAVDSTPEPATLGQAAPASTSYDWQAGDIETAQTKPNRSKVSTFLLWLAPVFFAVIIITYLQQRQTVDKPETKTVSPPVASGSATTPAAATAPAPPKVATVAATAVKTEKTPAPPPPATPAVRQEQDKLSDKALLTAIAETRPPKNAPATPSGARLKSLPDFIPRYGYDKAYSADNPGWERYKGQVTEFKLLREGQAIKAIQVIDRGGNGVPESFMKAVMRQVSKKPEISIKAAEKKDGYEIQRGSNAENISAVFYRDENGGKLRAFVLTWQ